MSNHYHIVLHLNIWEQSSLTLREFLTRWRSLYTVNYLVARYLREEPMCDAETHAIQEVGEQWRERLADLSWFMRALNESVAREANFEDRWIKWLTPLIHWNTQSIGTLDTSSTKFESNAVTIGDKF